METVDGIAGNGDENALQATRMAQTFVEVYQVTLIRIEQHLDHVIEEAGDPYAEGYKPWQKAVHDLVHGTFLLSKEAAKPDKELLGEALQVFSMDSSVYFLDEICSTIGIRTEREWHAKFRAHVHLLMTALNLSPGRLPAMGVNYMATPSSA
ncbi:MAG: hypothetical protein SFX19_03850 [Alphaproteobacteria bacterium]|nr:hypothetical protein [Alphaproteobacteria bacterium]